MMGIKNSSPFKRRVAYVVIERVIGKQKLSWVGKLSMYSSGGAKRSESPMAEVCLEVGERTGREGYNDTRKKIITQLQ